MRFICFLFLIAFAGAVVLFAYQNQHEITVTFGEWQITASVALFSAVIFLLGMFSGWSIVGMIRRSIHGVTHEREASGQYAYPR